MADNYVSVSVRALDEAKPDLDALKERLDELKGKVAEARADVDDAAADAKLTDLDAKLEAISKKVASPRIDMAGAARALAQLTAVEAAMDALPGRAGKDGDAAGENLSRGFLGRIDDMKSKVTGNTVGGLFGLKEDAEKTGDEAGESFSREFLGKMSGMSSKLGGSGILDKEEAGHAGEEDGGFFGNSFVTTFLGGKKSTITAGVGTLLGALPALGGIAGTGMGVALIGGLGAELLAQNSAVKSAASSMGTSVMATLSKTVTPLVPVITKVFGQIGSLMKSVAPELTAVFKVIAPQIEPVFQNLSAVVRELVSLMQAAAPAFGPFIDAILALVKDALPGITTAVKATVPAISMFSGIMGSVGKDLGGLFADAAPAIRSSMTVLGDLLKVVGGLLPVIMKLGAVMAGALAPVLTQVGKAVKALAPAFSAVAKLVAAFAQAFLGNLQGGLAAVIGLVTTLAPVVSKLARVFLQAFNLMNNRGIFNDIEDALEDLVGPIGEIVTALAGALMPVIPVVLGVLGQLAGVLQGALIEAVQAVTPSLVTFINGAGQLLKALTPLLPVIASVAAIVAKVLAAGLAAVLPLIVKLAPVILTVVGAMKAWEMIQGVLDALMDANPLGLLVIAVIALVGVIVELVRHWHDVAAAFGVVVRAGAELRHGLASAFDAIRHDVAAAVDAVIGFVERLFSSWAARERSGLDNIVSFFRGLPGRILHALGDLGSLLFSSGKKIIQGLINGIKSMIGDVGHAVSSVVDEVKSFLPFSPARKGPLSGAGAPVNSGRSIVRQIAQGITGGTPEVSQAMRRLAGSVSARGAGTAGLAVAGAGGGTQRIELSLSGNGSDALLKWLRQEIRIRGGNVQKVLGTGAA